MSWYIVTHQTFIDLLLTSCLFHSSCSAEWIVLPLPASAYWCTMTMTSPLWVGMTPAMVQTGKSTILVIVNTLDIHLSSSLADESHIFTQNTAISSALNQGSLSNILVTGDIVHDFGRVDLSVGNTIYVYLWWCDGVWFGVWCCITTRAWCSVG